MKRLWYFILALLIVFLVIDRQTYYYGLGSGFISKQIPEHFGVRMLFAGSDLGDQGMIIEEDAIGGVFLIDANSPIDSVFVSSDSVVLQKPIFVKKVLGYYFDDNQFVVKIADKNSNVVFVRIESELIKWEKGDYYSYQFIKLNDFNAEGLKFIDLDKSLAYFQHFGLVRNVLLIILVITSIIVLIRFISRKRKYQKDTLS